MIRTLLVLAFATLLGACGFHLRGSSANEYSLDALNLTAHNSYGDLVKNLRQTLERHGVQQNDQAAYRFDLSRETGKSRAISYTSSAREAEYEMLQQVEYNLYGPGNLLLLSDKVEARRIYIHDENNLIGSEKEQQQLHRELQQELVEQLALRLQLLTPARLERLQRQASSHQDKDASQHAH